MRQLGMGAVVALLLAGCGGEEHVDIKEWMKDAAKDIRPGIKPLPEIKPFPVVSYDANDLLDPFHPSKIEPERKAGGGGGNKPDFDRRKEELERYPLDALRFVGLLRHEKGLYAIIVADKKIYRVKIGNYLGENFGRITAIHATPDLDDGKLIIIEQVQEPNGDWVEREAVLEMQQEGRK